MKHEHADVLSGIKNGVIIVIVIPEQGDDPENNIYYKIDPEKIPG